MLTIVGIGLVAGLLIGSVGIGGVIVAPALTYLVGLEIHSAIAAALLGFGFSGAVGTLRYARSGAIEWSAARTLILAALPAAVAGALAIRFAPALLLKCLLGIVVSVSGLYGLRRGEGHERVVGDALSAGQLGSIGLLTGFGSVITGTGGPLLLVPIMIWLQQPIHAAVGLSQVIQVPISIAATATNIGFLSMDATFGVALALALALGCWIGTYVAYAVSAASLRRLVSCLLVVIGCGIVLDVFANMIS